MKNVLAAAFLCLVGACASSTVQLDIESQGAVRAAYDLNNLVVVPEGNGYASVKSKATGFPIYEVTFSEGVVLVARHKDPKFKATFKRGELLSAQAADIVRALLSAEQIAAWGLLLPEQ